MTRNGAKASRKFSRRQPSEAEQERRKQAFERVKQVDAQVRATIRSEQK